ncbi:MAG: serine/threonine-protein kinase [Planctomycetota bacterium]
MAAGRYSEFEIIGKGGMGAVYLALDSELNRQVAFKIVLPDPRAGSDAPAPEQPLDATPPRDLESDSARSFDELRTRFLQEAWVTSGMEHPGIVPVYELGETEEGVPYYTMRYVRGERTMKEAIIAAQDLDARLGLLEEFLKVCDTIRYAHARSVIHRDLKPENIALGSFGEVIVLDWGLAKVAGQPDVTMRKWQEQIEIYRQATDLKTVAGALGTPGFMAPEAALGQSEQVDARSDIYSLGAILFRILAGRLPFQFANFLEYVNQALRETPPRVDEVDPSVPKELADVCERALSRAPEDRYESVDELARAIRLWQTEGPIEREVRALTDEARDEVESARRLEGNLQLLYLDRATIALNRIIHLRPEHEEALELQARVKRMRERGIRKRVRSDRLAVLQRVAAGLLAIGAIVALIVFGMLNEERDRAARLEREAQAQVGHLTRARDRAESRLADAQIRIAEAHAARAEDLLADDRIASARIIAATALGRASTPAAWRTLAEAERRWTPTLEFCAYGVRGTALGLYQFEGLLLLIGDDEGRLHLIRKAEDSVERPRSWDAAESRVTAVAMFGGQEGLLLAAGGEDGRIAILQPDLDAPLATWPATLPVANGAPDFDDDTLYRDTAVTALTAGIQPGSLLAGYADGRIRLFDRDGNVQAVSRHHSQAVTALRRGLDKPNLISTAADGSINESHAETLLLLQTWDGPGDEPLAGLATTSFGVSTWTPSGSVYEWTPGREAKKTRLRGAPGDRIASIFVPEVNVMAYTGAEDGTLRFLDGDTGRVRSLGAHETSPLTVVAGAVGAPYFAAAREDGTIRVWNLAERGPGGAGALHRETRRVARVRRDGGLDLARTGEEEVQRLPGTLREPASAVSFSPDGRFVAAVTLSGRIEVWDVEQGSVVRAFDGQDVPLTAVDWATGDGRLLTGGLDGGVRLWPIRSGRPVSFEAATAEPILALSAESEGLRVAACDAAGTVLLWESENRTLLQSWPQLGRMVAIALDPGGERIVAVRDDGVMVRYDGTTWLEEGSLPTGVRPMQLTLDAAGEARWVDRRGLAGTGLRQDRNVVLPAIVRRASWVRSSAEQRVRALRRQHGLFVEGFSVRKANPQAEQPEFIGPIVRLTSGR